MGRKTRNRANGGFTLVEMLIVVAIIAVLLVVSLPLVSASIDKARLAADAANERAAKAAAMSTYLFNGVAEHETYFYKSDGTLVREEELEGAINVPIPGEPGFDYGQSKNHKDSYIYVMISDEDGTINIEIEWQEKK